jgi:hypothetical protein
LVSEYQFWSKFIPGYAKFKESLWRHLNYFDGGEWQKRFKKSGLQVYRIDKTNSEAAIVWADILLPIFWLGPLPFLVSFLERRGVFGFDKRGATLLIVARKT